jgi:hypothetical protein
LTDGFDCCRHCMVAIVGPAANDTRKSFHGRVNDTEILNDHVS